MIVVAASRDLPIPASPEMITHPPRPAGAGRSPRSWWRGRWSARSTGPGHRGTRSMDAVRREGNGRGRGELGRRVEVGGLQGCGVRRRDRPRARRPAVPAGVRNVDRASAWRRLWNWLMASSDQSRSRNGCSSTRSLSSPVTMPGWPRRSNACGARLDHRQTQLKQPGDLGLDEVGVCAVGVRQALPPGEGRRA